VEKIPAAVQNTSDAHLRAAFPSTPASAPAAGAPPIYSRLLSLIYHATSQFEKGCQYAHAWLQHVSKPGWKMPHEPGRTERLMQAMHCDRA